MATIAAALELRHEPCAPQIGSRVLNSREELLSGELAGQIRDLLEDRGVLVFPQVNFTDDEHIEFTKTLGTYTSEQADGTVSKVSLNAKLNPDGAEYQKGARYWHIDGTMNEVPILASLLACKQPAPVGTGNTGFCNTYAAWEALPEERKAELDGLRAVHGVWPTLFYYDPEPDTRKLKGMIGVGENELPVVWKHGSGRKSLVLGCTAQRIVGQEPKDGTLLIHELREWATQPQFCYSHVWTKGDLVMWDNTGTMHRAEWYDPDCDRMMVRTKLMGEESFE